VYSLCAEYGYILERKDFPYEGRSHLYIGIDSALADKQNIYPAFATARTL